MKLIADLLKKKKLTPNNRNLVKKLSFVLCCCLTAPAWSDNSFSEISQKDDIVPPNVQTKKAKPSLIDTENFELGTYLGWVSVEDFNTNALIGLNLNYHFYSGFYAQCRYGSSDTEKSSNEGTLTFNSDLSMQCEHESSIRRSFL